MRFAHFALFATLPVCMGVLMQQADNLGGGANVANANVEPVPGVQDGQATNLLRADGTTAASVVQPGAPKAAPKLTILGDAVFEVVTRSATITGYQPSKGPMSATVAFATFPTAHGLALKARIVRYQTEVTTDEHGNKIGRGTMDLTFSPDYARGGQQLDSPIGDGTTGREWKNKIIADYVRWRDAQGIPKPLLVAQASGSGLQID